MNERNTRVRDVPPEKVKAAVAGMSLADKLFTNAVMQMGLAFEAAKSSGKAAEENKPQA